LLKRSAMSASALHWLRHKQKPQGHPGNRERRNEEDGQLRQE
jgi:hypothetical protein